MTKKINKITETSLTLKQEKFCQLYTSKEFFGNGAQSYAEVYDIDLTNPRQNAIARTKASEFLTNGNILTRINELLDSIGFNDGFMDKQLLFAATQNADMNAKVKAISEYNKLKTRINNKLTVEVKNVTASFGSVVHPTQESAIDTPINKE